MFSFTKQQQQIEFLSTPFLSSLDLLFPVGDDLKILTVASVKFIWWFFAPWLVYSIPLEPSPLQLVHSSSFPIICFYIFLRMCQRGITPSLQFKNHHRWKQCLYLSEFKFPVCGMVPTDKITGAANITKEVVHKQRIHTFTYLALV